MTSRSYFGKMNSILGSVVPLAMFNPLILDLQRMDPVTGTWAEIGLLKEARYSLLFFV